MNEPPARPIGAVTRYVNQVAEDAATDAVADHERRCHAIPPPRRDPVTAIPWSHIELTDDQISHAIELLRDHDERAVAARMDVPLPALQRELADYDRRYGKFLHLRRRGP